jgi:hypothetical protein
MATTTADPNNSNQRLLKIDPCSDCCCPCRSWYGRPPETITYEFLEIDGSVADLDDVDLLPLGTGTWTPYARYRYDPNRLPDGTIENLRSEFAGAFGGEYEELSPEDQELVDAQVDEAIKSPLFRCNYYLEWISENFQWIAEAVPFGVTNPPYSSFGPVLQVTPTHNYVSRGPSGRYSIAYVHEDTRPKDSTGHYQRFTSFLDPETIPEYEPNPAWNGAKVHYVKLLPSGQWPDPQHTTLGDAYVTDDPTNEPPIIGTGPSGNPPPNILEYLQSSGDAYFGWNQFSDMYMNPYLIHSGKYVIGGWYPFRPQVSPTNLRSSGNYYCSVAPQASIRQKYAIAYWDTFEHLDIDNSYNQVGETVTPISATPYSRVGDVLGRIVADADPVCKCVPQASGEKKLAVTFVPAIPLDQQDGVDSFESWQVDAEPDNDAIITPQTVPVTANIAGPVGPYCPIGHYFSSAWRKLMGIPPVMWRGVDSHPKRSGFEIGNQWRIPPEAIHVAVGAASDLQSRCTSIRIGEHLEVTGYPNTIVASASESSPLEFRFNNHGSRVGNEQVAAFKSNDESIRHVGITAIEGGNTSNPFYPPGAVVPFLLFNDVYSSNLVRAYHAGYYGSGMYDAVRWQYPMYDLAESIGSVIPNLATGKHPALDGVWFTHWIDVDLSVGGWEYGNHFTGGYPGEVHVQLIKKITLTELSSGDNSIWEVTDDSSVLVSAEHWVNQNYPTCPEGTEYRWTSGQLKNTSNDFGPLYDVGCSVPFGRYKVEIEYFSNGILLGCGKTSRTNYFVNVGPNRDWNTFFFRNPTSSSIKNYEPWLPNS